MRVDLNKWYRCKIDNKILKELSKKSDWEGIKHIVIYFTSLFFCGYMAYYTWGSWWTVLWLFLYGSIYCCADPIWHETNGPLYTCACGNTLSPNSFAVTVKDVETLMPAS